MFPLIIVSKSGKKIDRYVDQYVKTKGLKETQLHRLFPEKNEFTIGQVRELKKELYYIYGDLQVYILQEFDKASLEAQNAVLKTLEEKNQRFQFILTVSSKETLVPTIQSRCSFILLDSVETNKPQKNNVLSLIESLFKPEHYSFLNANELQHIDREGAVSFIDSLIDIFRSRLNHDVLAAKVLHRCLDLRKLILYNNLSSQLTVDNLLIFIHKTYTIKNERYENHRLHPD